MKHCAKTVYFVTKLVYALARARVSVCLSVSVYVCVCTCLCICRIYVYLLLCIFSMLLRARMYVCVCVYVCGSVHAHMCKFVSRCNQSVRMHRSVAYSCSCVFHQLCVRSFCSSLRESVTSNKRRGQPCRSRSRGV